MTERFPQTARALSCRPFIANKKGRLLPSFLLRRRPQPSARHERRSLDRLRTTGAAVTRPIRLPIEAVSQCALALAYALITGPAFGNHGQGNAGHEPCVEATDEEMREVGADVALVWNSFLAAAAKGDLEGALSYLDSQSPFVGVLRDFGGEKLKRLAEGQQAFGLKSAYCGNAEAQVVVRMPEGGYRFFSVTFYRRPQGWLITSL